MRTEQLRIVEAVHRLGSFQRAAVELGLTQPAVGDAVRRLELELGTQLFERDAKGARLTRSGEIGLRYVRTMLQTEHASPPGSPTSSSARSASARARTDEALPTPARRRRRGQSVEQQAGTLLQVYQGGAMDIWNMLLLGRLDIAIFGKFRAEFLMNTSRCSATWNPAADRAGAAE